MEEAEEDDMTCGDLGNGLGRRPVAVYAGENSQNSCLLRSRRGSGKEDGDAAALPSSKRSSFYDGTSKKPATSSTRQNSCVSHRLVSAINPTESSTELSNEELKQQLQEALEAVFNKATSHTKAMLQKTEEEKRTLEKEINILQWEIEFDQDRFKNMEDTWTEKYDRIYCENSALKEALKLRTEEVKTLKAENAILNQQCLEFLAMLDVKQQKVVQENMSLNKSGIMDFTGLELAVLGACTCNTSGGQPCPCAKMAAVTRKHLLHLKREIENLKKSKDEAYIMADAFRIAFEQQLMQRKDQALRLAEVIKIKKGTKFMNWRRLKDDGRVKLPGNRNSLGQKLSGLLSSDVDGRKVEELDNPHEVLKMLIDLVNDKEEALAHQRKVSYMLARAMEAKEAVLGEDQGNGALGRRRDAAPASSGPEHARCWNRRSQRSVSAAPSAETLENPVKTLRKSRSWPSEAVRRAGKGTGRQ
ncbi:coiled-coil domain-containing protein 125 isoform X3 [Opisthocomus hoazin]|uniref:coiled-coil domain-containing protein 125 isoform X3 n=1 Tax=Opisthocomus hoazin TaxID=30419 RepID=UPI003F5368C5